MKKYLVMRCSPNGHVRKHVKSFSNWLDAYNYCEVQEWEYTDLSGTVWELEIDENY